MAKEILIADSDQGDQKEFQKIFETTDYHLVFSESGEDALLRAKLFKPDMIIASAGGLREMGGVEFCGAIKNEPDFKDVPFILISNIFDEISEQERKRARADGVISKPLNEDEVLNLVDHLLEEEVGKREEMVSEKSGFSLDEIGEGDEEIIELVDVVEEPEPKMSIDDLVATHKGEPLEIGSLDTWEKLEFEEKAQEIESARRPEKEAVETDLQWKEERPVKERSPEDELFEKIELEEILEKVEQLKPSLEKEWPAQSEIKGPFEIPSETEQPVEKRLDLSEFEAALQREVQAMPPEQEFAPILEPGGGTAMSDFTEFVEEPKRPEQAIPVEISAEEEDLKELPEEEFPDELLEEILGEGEISAIEGAKPLKPEEERPGEVRAGAVKADRLEEFEPPETFEREEASAISRRERPTEAVTFLSEVVDKHLEEVLAKGIQEMIGDFITKILPEMTQNIIGLTAERIEKMVKEVVPELAEKAIQEEIKRLQKGVKD